jgi:hypothetical protein
MERSRFESPSVIRLHKLATIEKNLIDRKIGELAVDDWKVVQKKMKELWESISIKGSK